ncbi:MULTISPECIES: CaiB/BaiF CoA-transferase family protein [Rhodomicrobium]|uniref:CaiB/BaiF CoA transferase family protein n=1 Tax=Rhodomicrobium TaxID=1068 RepID=UPI000B4AC0B6|nr:MULTISPECIES: CaiB/BaiF CoA-transferase family protein [Rhodomicrobium]
MAPNGAGALGRFTLIDLTRVRSGPACVRQLADFGANVIKVEMPPAADAGSEPLGGPREGSDFQNLQRNKRSLTLDLKQPDGRAILDRIVSESDVLVENFRPDVKDRLGIGYEHMRRVNPRLVYASISGFGQDGPYRDRPGFDQIAQGMGGLMSITGIPGQGPVRAGLPVADLSAGLFAALGILTALLEREVSGEGQWVTTSLLESQIFMLDFQAARFLADGVVPKQAGNDHPTSIPTGVFETSDGLINIATTGSAIWKRFCEAVEATELLGRAEYRTARDRSANRAALNAEIAAILRQRPTDDWLGRLNAAGVPCGPIYAIDEVFADPQVRHLGIAQSVQRPDGTSATMLGQPVTLARTPAMLHHSAPGIGEHTDEILAEFGYDADEIAAFRARKLI